MINIYVLLSLSHSYAGLLGVFQFVV